MLAKKSSISNSERRDFVLLHRSVVRPQLQNDNNSWGKARSDCIRFSVTQCERRKGNYGRTTGSGQGKWRLFQQRITDRREIADRFEKLKVLSGLTTDFSHPPS